MAHAHNRVNLLVSAFWGLLEGVILQTVAKLDKIWPQSHTRFMRLLHGHFGGTVVPFDQSFEDSPKNRSFSTRTPFISSSSVKRAFENTSTVNLHNSPYQTVLQKGDMLDIIYPLRDNKSIVH